MTTKILRTLCTLAATAIVGCMKNAAGATYDTSNVVLLAIFALALYLLPSMIASKRRHRNKNAIYALNILGGWTALGWIISIVWAFTNNTTPDPNEAWAGCPKCSAGYTREQWDRLQLAVVQHPLPANVECRTCSCGAPILRKLEGK